MKRQSSSLLTGIFLSISFLLTMTGCRLATFALTATPTSTSTPTPEYCAWTWAYGDGSVDFDNTVTQKLADKGLASMVKSSSYGEVNSCSNTYSPMALDVKIEIVVEDLSDLGLLAENYDQVFTILRENLSISEISNLGNVNLTFINSEGLSCYWDVSSAKCAE